ncbi:MAG: four helix bundle protein [Pirellula sp.]|jgi:hypothetical protein|nr:four helix bundle protein [Pirellula sp.]
MAQSVPINVAEGNGKQSLKCKNRFFEIVRGSTLECPLLAGGMVPFFAKLCVSPLRVLRSAATPPNEEQGGHE